MNINCKEVKKKLIKELKYNGKFTILCVIITLVSYFVIGSLFLYIEQCYDVTQPTKTKLEQNYDELCCQLGKMNLITLKNQSQCLRISSNNIEKTVIQTPRDGRLESKTSLASIFGISPSIYSIDTKTRTFTMSNPTRYSYQSTTMNLESKVNLSSSSSIPKEISSTTYNTNISTLKDEDSTSNQGPFRVQLKGTGVEVDEPPKKSNKNKNNIILQELCKDTAIPIEQNKCEFNVNLLTKWINFLLSVSFTTGIFTFLRKRSDPV